MGSKRYTRFATCDPDHNTTTKNTSNPPKRVTVKNARIVKIDADRNLLFVKGGVPGARNSYVRIVKAL